MRDHGRCKFTTYCRQTKFADTVDNACKIADIEKEVSEMKPKLNKTGRDEKTSDKSDDFEMKLESIIKSLKEKDSHVKTLVKKINSSEKEFKNKIKDIENRLKMKH